tara:strand:+ start:2951 stop:3703 length:753 start_codon:yes stop_codon:yes gene_type:complete
MKALDVGLIGRGKWGSLIKKKLSNISNLKFVIGKKTKFDNLIKNHQVKWVFIATPNITHFKIVKKCLKLKTNVFCEKPLTTTHKSSKELFKIAKKNNLKLYVSDIYSFHKKKIFKLKKKNTIFRSKNVPGNNKEFLNRFMYHDLSILYKNIQNYKIKNIYFKKIKNKKIFKVNILFKNKKELHFNYNLQMNQKKHCINNINLISKDDILKKMLKNVIYKKINFKKNEKKALFILKFIENLKKNYENRNLL